MRDYGNIDRGELIEELHRRNAYIVQLEAALKECADDLESELNGRFMGTLDYPSQRHRYERDMASAVKARRLLEGK